MNITPTHLEGIRARVSHVSNRRWEDLDAAAAASDRAKLLAHVESGKCHAPRLPPTGVPVIVASLDKQWAKWFTFDEDGTPRPAPLWKRIVYAVAGR